MPPKDNLYDTDFYAWTQQQADYLRSRNFENIDFDNLIEEMESMGKSEKRELESRLDVLLMHLLKWKYQYEGRSNSWRGTVKEQRLRLAKLLRENPSLKPKTAMILEEAYSIAIALASEETGLEDKTFPDICPWTFEQVMDEDFWPESE